MVSTMLVDAMEYRDAWRSPCPQRHRSFCHRTATDPAPAFRAGRSITTPDDRATYLPSRNSMGTGWHDSRSHDLFVRDGRDDHWPRAMPPTSLARPFAPLSVWSVFVCKKDGSIAVLFSISRNTAYTSFHFHTCMACCAQFSDLRI